MRVFRYCAALVILALPACSGGDAGPTDPAFSSAALIQRDRGVNARVEAGVLTLTNTTRYTVSAAVVESGYFERALRMWCFGSDACGTAIRPGKARRIPFKEIPGYHRGSVSAEVFWWRAGLNPESDQPIRIHQFRVRLHRR